MSVMGRLVKFIYYYYFFFDNFYFLFRRKTHLYNANKVDPDQMPPFAASDLGLHCLHTSYFI